MTMVPIRKHFEGVPKDYFPGFRGTLKKRTRRRCRRAAAGCIDAGVTDLELQQTEQRLDGIVASVQNGSPEYLAYLDSFVGPERPVLKQPVGPPLSRFLRRRSACTA